MVTIASVLGRHAEAHISKKSVIRTERLHCASITGWQARVYAAPADASAAFGYSARPRRLRCEGEQPAEQTAVTNFISQATTPRPRVARAASAARDRQAAFIEALIATTRIGGRRDGWPYARADEYIISSVIFDLDKLIPSIVWPPRRSGSCRTLRTALHVPGQDRRLASRADLILTADCG